MWLFALLFNVLACTATAYAAEVRYDYDALGRLIRVIDEQGRVTEYVYDPAGNILQVTGAGAGGAQAPVITSITPVTLRQGRSYAVQVSGSNLLGVRVTTPDPALDNSNLIVSATSVTFTLTIGATAAVGNHVLTFTNAAGSTQSTITVVTAITYTYVMIPSPLALPPNNVSRQFTIVASQADTGAIVFTASTLNPAIARAGTSPLLLAAGQTQVTGTVAGIAAGSTALTLTSPAFVDPTPINIGLIYVSADFADNSAHTKVLGVVKGDPTNSAANGTAGPYLAPVLGVLKGDPTRSAADGTTGPYLTPMLGVVKGDPTNSAADGTTGPYVTPILGVVKGDPTNAAAGGTTGPYVTPILGVVKGDPTNSAADGTTGPYVAPILGVQKQ